ncbi:hypothetical protein M9Y10_035498 [Tritrichomonas musculus]|uniref:Enkurin domain-containing protein n=1 Tax=Tritrichomonas musculus TaxID=1915356 RepID=A0ABR2KIC8_9EUKA
MEARLRYQKELRSGGVKKNINTKPQKKKLEKPPVEAKKKVEKPPPEPVNKVDITRSAPKEIPKAYGEPRIDFIQRNINQAANQKSRAHNDKVPNRKDKIINQRHAPGEIPRYSTKRTLDTESTNELDEPMCPPGMRLLSEEEKAQAIEDLTEQKLEIESTLGRSPLHIESPQLLRNKRMLEQELKDIESSLEQLKKKYVFVPE